MESEANGDAIMEVGGQVDDVISDDDSFASEEIVLPESSENDSESCYLPQSDHDELDRPESPPLNAHPLSYNSPLGSTHSPVEDIPDFNHKYSTDRQSKRLVVRIKEDDLSGDSIFEHIQNARSLVLSQQGLLRNLEEIRFGLNKLLTEAESMKSEFNGRSHVCEILDSIQRESQGYEKERVPKLSTVPLSRSSYRPRTVRTAASTGPIVATQRFSRAQSPGPVLTSGRYSRPSSPGRSLTSGRYSRPSSPGPSLTTGRYSRPSSPGPSLTTGRYSRPSSPGPSLTTGRYSRPSSPGPSLTTGRYSRSSSPGPSLTTGRYSRPSSPGPSLTTGRFSRPSSPGRITD